MNLKTVRQRTMCVSIAPSVSRYPSSAAATSSACAGCSRPPSSEELLAPHWEEAEAVVVAEAARRRLRSLRTASRLMPIAKHYHIIRVRDGKTTIFFGPALSSFIRPGQ